MKASFLTVSAALACSAALAGETDPAGQFALTKGSAARAPSLVDSVRFQPTGADPWATHYSQLTDFRSYKTRAEVAAEFIAARDEVLAFSGEDSGSMYLARLPSMRLDRDLVIGRAVNPR